MTRHQSHAPVAIIGIGCRFPGGVKDPAGFWRLLDDGVDAITRIPSDRMDVDRLYDPSPATPGRIMTTWGGFLDGLRDFDAEFFSMSPREAERLDPQQRLLLETAWEALEDAGQDVRRLEGSRTGVFVGQWLSDFEGRLFADPEAVDFYMTTGSGRYATSGRVSYAFGLTGPSLTLDTACSSSLAAVHLAVQSIRSGESSLALAAGVNVILQPHITVAYSQSRMMAPDGRCKFGDAQGDGYVRSEGAGVVVLKPLEQALTDGDRIYALIRGSAINNDGRSSGSLGTPSRRGQEELLRAAYADAGVRPGAVGYVEAHGTGTRAGDPVELGALTTVLADGRKPGHGLVVGSVKTNIGHTEGAAGIAGIIKATLALHRGRIPASLNCRELNPAVAWSALPLELARTQRAWPGGNESRLAGVSAFGIAGSNAHVVLESGPTAPVAESWPATAFFLPLSARSAAALRARASAVAVQLRAPGAPDPRDVCHSAARLAGLEHRAVFLTPDAPGLLAGLDAFGSGEDPAVEGVVDPAARPKVAFVVPGQGGQWTGMARDLMLGDATFRTAIDACDDAIGGLTTWSLREQLLMDQGDPDWLLDRIDVIQPALVAVAIAYAAWWRARGLTPDAVVGHSLGEVGAAFLAGAIDLRSAMHLICRRSALMHRTSGMGAMAMLELTVDEAQGRLRGYEDRVNVAVSNSPRATVISGEPDAVRDIVAAAERDGVFCRMVKVDVASHSPQMEPLAAELAAEFAALEPGEAQTPLYSAVLARRIDGRELGGPYWGRNLRESVRFAETIKRMVEDGIETFIELGPHPVLKPALEQVGQAASRSLTVIACGARDEPGPGTLLGALGAAWTAGIAVDLRTLGAGRHVSLVTYPWQRERHWLESAEAKTGVHRQARATLDDTTRGWIYRMHWTDVTPGEVAAAAARWLVVGADDVAREVAAAAVAHGAADAVTTGLESLSHALRTFPTPDNHPSTVVVLVDDEASAWVAVQVAQAVLAAAFPTPPRIWFATRGAHCVADDDASGVRIPHAALWGAALVIGGEHPELWGGLVDRDPAGTGASDAAGLVRAILWGREDQVAVRQAVLRTRRLVSAAIGQPDSAPSFEGPWLITGGLGDVGLHLARRLAAAGARRLILLGRTPLPPRSAWASSIDDAMTAQRVAAVRELEAAGVAVHLATVDVGDPTALDAFLQQYASEAWPPIRGVVHAAAFLRNHLVDTMDRASFEAVVGTKLGGAVTLDRLLPEAETFIVLSSIGAFLPQPGKVNYAAACSGLDALAAQRRARGQHALSIQWGVWQDTGLVRDEAGVRGVAEMRRQGIEPFAPSQGAAIFEALVARATAGTVAVLPANWSAWRESRRGHSSNIARDLVAATAAHEPGNDDGASATPAEQRAQLERVVREAIGHVLKMAPMRIDPRKTLGAMGLNSLLAMELRNRLEAALRRPLSATIAWNHPTVEALVQFLSGSAPDSGRSTAPSSPAPATAPDGDVDRVATMTDAEALRALRRRGSGSTT